MAPQKKYGGLNSMVWAGVNDTKKWKSHSCDGGKRPPSNALPVSRSEASVAGLDVLDQFGIKKDQLQKADMSLTGVNQRPIRYIGKYRFKTQLEGQVAVCLSRSGRSLPIAQRWASRNKSQFDLPKSKVNKVLSSKVGGKSHIKTESLCCLC